MQTFGFWFQTPWQIFCPNKYLYLSHLIYETSRNLYKLRICNVHYYQLSTYSSVFLMKWMHDYYFNRFFSNSRLKTLGSLTFLFKSTSLWKSTYTTNYVSLQSTKNQIRIEYNIIWWFFMFSLYLVILQ